MKINLDYDAALNVLFTSYPGVSLKSEADVEHFFQAIENKCKTIPRKVYVVANLEGFEVDARVAEFFGAQMALMHQKYVIALVRYNLAEGFPKISIRMASLKAGRPSRILGSKEEALAEVRRLQAEAGNK